jgi:alkanesulfonate monooxygenase SsuD/methylene tetrahydromethanopterin reductase-like flavin-dependent oxidoreductase (luciferase family)
MLEEQLQIVRRSWEPGPFDFEGRHYRVRGLDALPKPIQHHHPNLIVGGSGGRRSVGLAARWADEYNTVFASPPVCRERRHRVERAWKQCGRDPATAVFSVMTGGLVGRDRDDLAQRAALAMERHGRQGSVDGWLDGVRHEWVVGTVDEAVARLREYEAAGVDRVMLQHQRHQDVEMVAILGQVAAAVAA